jgi:hypothetical protein
MQQRKSTICRHFSRTGKCHYGANCKFTHSENNSQTQESIVNNSITSFFSIEKYQEQIYEQWTKNFMGLSTDHLIFFWGIHENEVNYVWKRVLDLNEKTKWALKSQTQVVIFFNSALYALRQDHNVQGFIKAMGTTYGMDVLDQILSFPIEVDAGKSRNCISFQRGFVPLFFLLTSHRMKNAGKQIIFILEFFHVNKKSMKFFFQIFQKW